MGFYTRRYRSKLNILGDQYKDTFKSRFIGGNCVEFEDKQGNYGIRLHDTTIITARKNGTATLNAGTWRTVLTKRWMNRWLEQVETGLRVASWRDDWYLFSTEDGHPVSRFYNNMEIDLASGSVIHVELGKDHERELLKRKLTKYLDGLKSVAEPIHPGAGDCWGCLLINQKTGKPDGFGTSHLLSHLDEGYYVGSLIINALRECGLSDIGIYLYYNEWKRNGKTPDPVIRAVRRHFKRNLGLA